MRVGFFREMPHGDAYGPTIAEARRYRPGSHEKEIAEYLEQGHVRIFTPGISHDVFDQTKLAGTPHRLTDGRFEWPGDLAYYVRNYHIRLPVPFVEHMRTNAWRVPSDVDVTTPLWREGRPYTDVKWLTNEAEIVEFISLLAPRNVDFHTYEIVDGKLARPFLQQLSVEQRLLATAAAGPVLWDEIRVSCGYRPDEWTIAEHFRDQFPPREPISTSIPQHMIMGIQNIAQGEPGEPVAYGLFPSRTTKLARLLLARADVYSAESVLRAARHAYDKNRSHKNRSYYAHDAFACALVHPRIDAREVAEWHSQQLWGRQGWRSRRKVNRLLAWARLHVYLPDPSACSCGHDKFTVPLTRRTVMELSRHRDKIGDLLESVEVDPLRWLAVRRCTQSGEFWAEDDITSGQAEMFFCYPIETSDPKAWLSQAEPLHPRIRTW